MTLVDNSNAQANDFPRGALEPGRKPSGKGTKRGPAMLMSGCAAWAGPWLPTKHAQASG